MRSFRRHWRRALWACIKSTFMSPETARKEMTCRLSSLPEVYPVRPMRPLTRHSRQFTSPHTQRRKTLLACVCLLLTVTFSESALAQSQPAWTFAGPEGASDRIVALAVDPRTDSVLYAAAPDGGLWKT